MKKLGSIMLILIMAISTGCSGAKENTTPQINSNTVVESASATAKTSVKTEAKTEAKEETTSAGSSSDEASDIQKNNPIDKVFDNDLFNRSSMNEFNILSALYSGTWNNELKNISENIRKCYTFPEDQKMLDEYVASCEDLAQKASALELLNWQHTLDSPGKRGSSMGAAGATRMAEAKIYKDAVLHLIGHFNSMPDRSGEKYQFMYKNIGSELDKLKASIPLESLSIHFGDKIKVSTKKGFENYYFRQMLIDSDYKLAVCGENKDFCQQTILLDINQII